MSNKNIARIGHRNHNDALKPPRTGDVTHAEAAVDINDHILPQLEGHGCAAHDWGVATGLEVEATNGQQGVRIRPGIALDAAGRSIALAATSNAEISTNDPPIPAVSASAVGGMFTLPTAGLGAGPRHVVIQWHETFDDELYGLYGQWRWDQTPWLRLVPPGAFADDGNRIVLAEVTVDGSGNVTGLDRGLRRNIGLPVEKIRVLDGRRATGAPNHKVDSVEAAQIQPLPDGGLEIKVPNATDRVVIGRDAGTFAQCEIQADKVYLRDAADRDTILLNTAQGSIRAGTQQVSGELYVTDSSGQSAMQMYGSTAAMYLGASNNEGDLFVRTDKGHTSIHLNGGPGDIRYTGRLVDINGRHDGVTHTELADLTDGGITSLHKHWLGALGYWGASGTKLGIVSGFVELGAFYGKGDVQLDLRDHTAPVVYPVTNVAIHGYMGSFSSTPHAFVAPTQMAVSTHDNAVFGGFPKSVSSTHLTIHWHLNAHTGPNYINFIVIGPI